MSFSPQIEAPPLREDADGALRVGDSHVLLELVVRAFQDGATAEAIVQRYSTLTLPDTYAVIAYYLRHRPEIEQYLAARERRADDIWKKIDNSQNDLNGIRSRLAARRSA